MPRKLKTFQTSLGFYDLAIAAPAMKAALEAFSPQGRTCVREGAAAPEGRGRPGAGNCQGASSVGKEKRMVRVPEEPSIELAGSALLEFQRGKRARGAATIQGV